MVDLMHRSLYTELKKGEAGDREKQTNEGEGGG